MYFAGSLKLGINDRPTIPVLLNFPMSSGETINLAVEISEYDRFSKQLLQDMYGNELELISHGFGPRPERILREVFKRWLAGSGKPSKTWKTLIQTLKETNLLALAETLESQLAE